ncbi:MAG: hypothetical protein JW787_10605 [Sedimentisphaerales bacterium]|nr:hypothetical protein [Sedimentisphaerales bacterium]
MSNRYLILIASLTAILIFGCGDSYNFAKDYRFTTSDEVQGYTTIELGGMGGLKLADGRSSDDYLIVQKYNYKSLTVYYRLLYQHNFPGDTLSPERLIFIIDKQRYILTFLGSDKSGFFERAWVLAELPFLEKIANANKVELRVEGSSKSIDYVFNKRYLYFFRRFYKECVQTE